MSKISKIILIFCFIFLLATPLAKAQTNINTEVLTVGLGTANLHDTTERIILPTMYVICVVLAFFIILNIFLIIKHKKDKNQVNRAKKMIAYLIIALIITLLILAMIFFDVGGPTNVVDL